MNDGAVLIVDNDMDDRESLQEAWKELKYQNQIIFFKNGQEVLNYLKNEKTPFMILCDVNIPGMDGFELKEKIKTDGALHYKSIPFVFWSGLVSQTQIQRAYDLGVNGFFVKENNYNDLKQSLMCIVSYWLKSVVPE